MKGIQMDRYVVLGVGRYIVNFEEILEAQYAAANHAARFEIVGFIDSDPTKHGRTIFGYPVLGPVDWIQQEKDVINVLSFVNPRARAELVAPIRDQENCRFPNVIHPTAVISGKAAIGRGNIIAQNVVVAPYVTIGDFTLLNYAVTIGHDCTIGDYTTCNGGAHVAGSSVLEARVFVGPGAVIIDGATVGQGAKVGANAVVRQTIPPDATAVGIPARII
jgi:sugar O-acyltransferase (sialic acid O-acetyltransferase NeuD family)